MVFRRQQGKAAVKLQLWLPFVCYYERVKWQQLAM